MPILITFHFSRDEISLIIYGYLESDDDIEIQKEKDCRKPEEKIP